MIRWSWLPHSSTSCTLLGCDEEARIVFVGPPAKGEYSRLGIFIVRLILPAGYSFP